MRWGTERMRKLFVITALIAGGLLAIACGSGSAPRNSDTTQSDVPAVVNAVPVTVTGSGESVQTIELVDIGYTVAYESASSCLIVEPVLADGSGGMSIINECNFDGVLTGTAIYDADGPVTVHVYNTNESWSLTFTPLQ